MDGTIEKLIRDLPDPEAAVRFLDQLKEAHPSAATRLASDKGLLLDVLTLVAYSPLLATTFLQNPNYLWWLGKKRSESHHVRNKDELLESLARFALTNSQIDTSVLLSRFRRRELMRIFLSDIRRLATMAEITEKISNLADAILEHALRVARQELDNRYGTPLATDAKGRSRPAEFCIVSLGKLGSKELNYSSDIDLLFLYRADGTTSGTGSRGVVTNREYFVKLAETVTALVGGQSGEGPAYRVDLRLRPHGSIGPLAIPVADAIQYYRTEARDWERQVLIRSRASAGDTDLFREFVKATEDIVFAAGRSVEEALESVRRSKDRIDKELAQGEGFNVKLGAGGIREIEFLAQALQLAYGGPDVWLRSPHTLISLTRLADRHLISESELTSLFDAYEFLRHLEHILQMEHGLQTHRVPDEPKKRELTARRMGFRSVKTFDNALSLHTRNVHKIFVRVFNEAATAGPTERSQERWSTSTAGAPGSPRMLELTRAASSKIAALIAADPERAEVIAGRDSGPDGSLFGSELMAAVAGGPDVRQRLAALRTAWNAKMLEIAVSDLKGELTLREAKDLQTDLAEASIESALWIARDELQRRYAIEIGHFPFAVLALGKLGGAGIDYDSDLDLVLVYDEEDAGEYLPPGTTAPEFYGRAADTFVSSLSAVTREGQLYRVDLRLRPYGKSGPSVISTSAFEAYMTERAEVWELLAYVKIRGVAGGDSLAQVVEENVRRAIHQRALLIDPDELRSETGRIRKRLEAERSRSRRGRDVDIKYGEGGMLDIYFAMRYLQLRDNIPDDTADRSSEFMLQRLAASGSLTADEFEILTESYRFLSKLDHELRLRVGRSPVLPLANKSSLALIAEKMELSGIGELIERLTVHRLGNRQVFDSFTK